jgi:hypothetical protein
MRIGLEWVSTIQAIFWAFCAVVYLSLGASWPAVSKKRVARREEDWLGSSGASPTSVLLILLDYSRAAMARKRVIDLVPFFTQLLFDFC